MKIEIIFAVEKNSSNHLQFLSQEKQEFLTRKIHRSIPDVARWFFSYSRRRRKKRGDFRCCWWLPSLIWLTTGCSILDDEQFVCSKSIEEIIEQALGLCSSYWWSDNRDEMNKSNDLRKARGNFDREGRMNNGTFFFLLCYSYSHIIDRYRRQRRRRRRGYCVLCYCCSRSGTSVNIWFFDDLMRCNNTMENERERKDRRMRNQFWSTSFSGDFLI